MTTFTYTGGDPTNLVGGKVASMTDIKGSFTDIPTFINGNIDTTNLATSAKPSTLLGVWRTITQQTIVLIGNTFGSATTLIMGTNATATSGNTSIGFSIFPINIPTVTGLTTQLRLNGTLTNNATSIGTGISVGLHQVTACSGGAVQLGLTLAAAVSGSSVSIGTPTANTIYQITSSNFSAPTAGAYVLAVTTTSAGATDSYLGGSVALQMRHV